MNEYVGRFKYAYFIENQRFDIVILKLEHLFYSKIS